VGESERLTSDVLGTEEDRQRTWRSRGEKRNGKEAEGGHDSIILRAANLLILHGQDEPASSPFCVLGMWSKIARFEIITARK
jgi:hypothetical protein